MRYCDVLKCILQVFFSLLRLNYYPAQTCGWPAVDKWPIAWPLTLRDRAKKKGGGVGWGEKIVSLSIEIGTMKPLAYGYKCKTL